jgi:hypothetical protein
MRAAVVVFGASQGIILHRHPVCSTTPYGTCKEVRELDNSMLPFVFLREDKSTVENPKEKAVHRCLFV